MKFDDKRDAELKVLQKICTKRLLKKLKQKQTNKERTMRILDLGEAGYEGFNEAQRHYFYIDGDYDPRSYGITDYDCDEITKQLVGMGLQALTS